MAFMGIFLVNLIIILFIIGTATTIAIVLFVAAAVLKKRQMILKKKAEEAGDYNYKIKKTYLVCRIFGGVFSVPLAALVGLIIYSVIAGSVEAKTSLSYNVFSWDTAQAEKILKKGVNPDCTKESNNPAKDGEETLLYMLAADHYPDLMSADKLSAEERKENRIEMMKLLIKYGADVNYVAYREEKNSSCHRYEDEYSIYNNTDKCGSTPIMAATYSADLDMIKLLVENGADVNAVDYCGFNVIDIVADNFDDENGYEIFEYYLEKGVDPLHETNFKQTAAFLAFRQTTGSLPFNNNKILGELETREYGNEDWDIFKEYVEITGQ